MGVPIAAGLQFLQDQQMLYKRSSTPCFMRFRKFGTVTNQQWSQLGFTIAPTDQPTGTDDVLITPTPGMFTMSLQDIGLNGGKLRFGAKRFFISATFVNLMIAKLELGEPRKLWQQALGILNEGMLYSIEDVQHEAVFGQIINWIVICNANEKG